MTEETINYNDEIINKEDLDFKIEVGRNHSNDKIIRVSSKNPESKEYNMLFEIIADSWDKPIIDNFEYEDLTYVESMNKFFKLNPCEFSKEDIKKILEVVNKYG